MSEAWKFLDGFGLYTDIADISVQNVFWQGAKDCRFQLGSIMTPDMI